MKRNPYRAAFAAMTLALLVACAPANAPVSETVASPPGAEATLAAALDADRAFAAAVAKDGPKTAFLAWFHPTDSQFIEAGATMKGAEAIAAPFDQSPPGFALAWTPDGGVGSELGDFAATTGRFTVKMQEQVLAEGRYMTAWRKDADGAWKVVMDATVADPAAPPTTMPDPEGRPG